MHAWIDGEGDRYYINDAGSRTGTRVNGQRIVARHLLGDEDEITIGPAKLTFLAEPRVRPGVESFDLSAEPKIAPTDDGIAVRLPLLHRPAVGRPRNSPAGPASANIAATNWLSVPRPGQSPSGKPPAAAVARRRKRRPRRRTWGPPRPGDDLLVSRPRRGPTCTGRCARRAGSGSARAAPAGSAPTAATPRSGGTDLRRLPVADQCLRGQTTCPSCGLVFHAECWAENYGCSAYGCPQVNALKPPAAERTAPPGARALSAPAIRCRVRKPARHGGRCTTTSRAPLPWEFLLLAGSVFSALLGRPDLRIAVAGPGRRDRHLHAPAPAAARSRTAHRGIILLSAGLAVLGVVAGCGRLLFSVLRRPSHF